MTPMGEAEQRKHTEGHVMDAADGNLVSLATLKEYSKLKSQVSQWGQMTKSDCYDSHDLHLCS